LSRDGRHPYLLRQEAGKPGQRIPIDRFPFRIGRSREAEFTVPSREVSSFHAEIVRADDGFLVRDLGSRNGTFVNGERIAESPLGDGDILHIAQEECRFGVIEESTFSEEDTMAVPQAAQQQVIREANDLERLFAQRAVTAVFQPIVRLDSGERTAYETLGRPAKAVTSYDVGQLFRIATLRGEGGRLSRLFRAVALSELPRLRERPITVFFNLHPHEMVDAGELGRELETLVAALAPGQRAVLEIHESAVTDLRAMEAVRAQLRGLGIGLAYDDFGAGQSRLMELIEVPPDFLKLDMSLVRDIDRNSKRQELVRALVKVMADLGIEVLAEGIERADEGAACHALGCTLAQGYFYGRPGPAGD
jgi:EAL domain-containing protein (putative c-di-GMP-specific phosphodiesterase class I)